MTRPDSHDPLAPYLARQALALAAASARWGSSVTLDPVMLRDRSDGLDLALPGVWSPNRSCRLVQARDGWIAVNLPRADDLASVPAWIGCGLNDEPWAAIATAARHQTVRALIDQAVLLGLPVAMVGEVHPAPAHHRRMAAGRIRHPGAPLKVLDLSSLWAGPLCGGLLAQMGADVTKVESLTRRDPTPASLPGLDARLNGGKARVQLDFGSADGRAQVLALAGAADVLITSARARALAGLGLVPETLFAANPGLVWVAVTGHGWDSDRVAFGDDAAAAGGLLHWVDGMPQFIGDALGDPLTGLAAAVAGLAALDAGGGVLIDAALAQTAATAAHACGLVD